MSNYIEKVSILILLDYLFLSFNPHCKITGRNVSILILLDYLFLLEMITKFFEGLDIPLSQSLFYWIIYSYEMSLMETNTLKKVSILILLDYLFLSSVNQKQKLRLLLVSILILLDYLFLLHGCDNQLSEFMWSQSLFYWIIYSYM